MTAPKKPARRPLRALVVASTAPAPPLTAAEFALLASFRTMDDRSQAFVSRVVVAQAVRCPRRALPSLRLVQRGAV